MATSLERFILIPLARLVLVLMMLFIATVLCVGILIGDLVDKLYESI